MSMFEALQAPMQKSLMAKDNVYKVLHLSYECSEKTHQSLPDQKQNVFSKSMNPFRTIFS
jgi:hypothetical protein